MSDKLDSDNEKNPGGRPLKFQTVKELKQKIEAYFGACDPHEATRSVVVRKSDGTTYVAEEQYITEQKPYTITGLALALKTTRDVLLDYESGKYDDRDDTDEDGERFSNAVKEAKIRVQARVEEMSLNGAGAGTIFWLKNNAGWKDKTEVDHTTNGESIALVEIVRSGGSTNGQD